MAYGVTSTGFVLKTQSEIQTELEDAFTTAYGSDIVLNEDQPLGQMIGIFSEYLSQAWEGQQASYNAFDPDNAFGNGLSDLVQLNNITRQPTTSSTVTLVLLGTSGTVIPAGSLCSTDADDDGNSIVVSTDEDVTLLGDTVEATVTATCTETGVIVISEDSIINIDTPITGWTSVNNPDAGDEGEVEETDVQLRARRTASVGIGATSVVDSIYANIAAVDNVKYVRIYQNETSGDDPLTGQPPYTFQCVVDGGLDEDVATAIFLKKPVGIQAYGSEFFTVVDDNGFTHEIGVTRPTDVPIYIDVTVTATSPVAATLEDDIKANIISYAAGELFDDREFDVGDDIPVTKILTPINRTDGVDSVTAIAVDRVNPPVLTWGETVEIGFDEISTWLEDNITITITT